MATVPTASAVVFPKPGPCPNIRFYRTITNANTHCCDGTKSKRHLAEVLAESVAIGRQGLFQQASDEVLIIEAQKVDKRKRPRNG